MINWISTKELSKLPDTDRKVMVMTDESDTIHTAIFRPEIGWQMVTNASEQYTSARITTIAFWSDYNLPK